MRTNNFDPLAYIENAFLDKKTEEEEGTAVLGENLEVAIPALSAYIDGVIDRGVVEVEEIASDGAAKKRFRKTVMSAPRPRRAKKGVPAQASAIIDPELQTIWQALPKNVEFLCSFYDDSVTANYYRGEFKETRQELIRRLLDPELSLEETARLLGVCPATVRRYTNRGWLTHHRTAGGQRRFRLSDIVQFVEMHGRFPEE
ncbi:MAG TPA: helix-turn-helix domain-containing protein [Fimbriimonas sp.]